MAAPVFSWNAKTTEDKAKASSYSTTLPKTKNPDPTIVDRVATAGKNAIKNTVEAVKNPSVILGRLDNLTGLNNGFISKGTDGKLVANKDTAQKIMQTTVDTQGGQSGVEAFKDLVRKGVVSKTATLADNIAPKLEEAPFSWNKTTTPVQRGTKPNPLNAEKARYDTPNGNEYVPDEQLPTIQLGSKPKSDIPVIQTQPKTPKAPGDLTYEPIPTPKQEVKMPKTVSNDVATQGSKNTEIGQSNRVTVQKPFTESGTKTPVNVAKPFKAEAPKQTPRVSKMDFSKSTFENTSWERESKLYSELSDDEVQKIASGKMTAPNGANSTYVWTEAKLKAIDEGDIQKIKELADSPVGTSKAAQDLQFGKNAKMANDPVEAIQEIQKSRLEKIDKKILKETTDEGKKILSDIRTNFLNSFKC